MNRLPLYCAVIVLGNCRGIAWHLLILTRLYAALNNDQILLIAGFVNLIPFTAAILPWTRFRKIAAGFTSRPFGCSQTNPIRFGP